MTVTIGAATAVLGGVRRVPCVRLSATKVLHRPDVKRLIEDGQLASWGTRGGYLDAFVWYDQGEGTHAGVLPDDVWDLIGACVRGAGLAAALVWLADDES